MSIDKSVIKITLEEDDNDEDVYCSMNCKPNPININALIHATAFLMGYVASMHNMGYELTLDMLRELAMTSRFPRKK